MSRISLSQPQGSKRRDGPTTDAMVRRFCSKRDDVVPTNVDPLGSNGR